MARKSKKKNVNIPIDFKDYYVFFNLDRNLKTKEILRTIRAEQGNLRVQMSNGSLNGDSITSRLQEALAEVEKAIKVFKNDERRKEYDIQLNAAYEMGKIRPETQQVAHDLYEELLAMFMKENYNGVIRRCMEALDQRVGDYRVYILLAQSYFALRDPDNSLNSIDRGLNHYPDNIDLLRAGARFANVGKGDYERSQRYINRMIEIDPESHFVASEQSYLYLTTGKSDLAYQTIDDYVAKNPRDREFKKDCAYDLLGFSYEYYTKDPKSDVYVIASQEDYQKCLDTCSKAESLYSDDNTKEALKRAQSFGQVEFNAENKENIIWSFVGAAIYILGGLPAVAAAFQDKSMIGAAILCMFLGVLTCASAIGLVKCSYRPYWQINKFILTGRREKWEAIFVGFGNIFAGYIKWSLKIGWKVSMWALRLGMGI